MKYNSLKHKFHLSSVQLTVLIALVVVILDQALKIWVKTSFFLGESREITSWFHLTFVENNGMAFGWEFGSKLFLTLFRIIFVGAIIYMLVNLRNRHELKRGFLVCVALVIAGAIGNIIDCMFYGLIFSESTPTHIATMFPEGGGYGTFLHGKVVDMLSFELFSFNWPSWVPFVGGEHFTFFQPIFNLADSAITVGVLAIIFFYSKQVNLLIPERFKSRKQTDSNPDSNNPKTPSK